MTTKTESSAVTEFLSWRNNSSPDKRRSSLVSATSGSTSISKPSSTSHPFATNLGDSPALLRRRSRSLGLLDSSLPDEIFLFSPNESSSSSTLRCAESNNTCNDNEHDDSISLGSYYKDLYKELPIQVPIDKRRSCNSSCCNSILTPPLQRSTTLQEVPTTPKVRRTSSISKQSLAFGDQDNNNHLTKSSSKQQPQQQQGSCHTESNNYNNVISTPMTLATTITDFSSSSSVEGLPQVPFPVVMKQTLASTKKTIRDEPLAVQAVTPRTVESNKDDVSSSSSSSSSSSQQLCQPSRRKICSNRFQVAVRLRPCSSSEDVSSAGYSEQSGVAAAATAREQSQHPRSPGRLRGLTRLFTHSSKVSAWEIQEQAADDDDYTCSADNGSSCSMSQTASSQQVLVQKDVSRPVSGRHLFSFDSIYPPETSTDRIYQETAKPVVQNVVNGKHGTVFAYGPTGSGKTFTMQGNGNDSKGIVMLAARDLLRQLLASNRDFELHAQFVEIYNEQIRDLLAPTQQHQQQQQQQQQEEEIVGRTLFRSPKHKVHNNRNDNNDKGFLTLRDERQPDGSLSVTIPHAKQVKISSLRDITKVLAVGNQNRATGATALNAQSSRSHAIFRLLLTVKNETDVRQSVLNLVDLAGSENSTQASITGGLHKRETGKINQSLLSLSRVIHALSLPPNKRPKHIGYRDSKLTRMLQPHLSGNACIAVLCCVSTARRHLEETRSALKFAASAKRIQVQPIVNSKSKGKKPVDEHAILLSLQKELKETKESLSQLQAQLDETRRSSTPAVTIKSIGAGVRPITPDHSVSQKGKAKTVSETWTNRGVPLLRHVVFDRPILIDPVEDNDDFASTEQDNNGDQSFSSEETVASSEAVLVMDSAGELDAPMDITARVESDDGEDHEMPLNEVTIMIDSFTPAKNPVEQLENAQERAAFLAEKLEATDDLVESLFKELREEQSKNAELLNQVVKLEDKIERLEIRAADDADHLNLLVQQCMLLKYGITIGLGLFVCGQEEGFLVTVLFLWLTLAVIKRDD